MATSPRVAKIAKELLKDKKSSKELKTICKFVLGGHNGKSKKKT